MAQSAARRIHNPKVVSSSLTVRIFFLHFLSLLIGFELSLTVETRTYGRTKARHMPYCKLAPANPTPVPVPAQLPTPTPLTPETLHHLLHCINRQKKHFSCTDNLCHIGRSPDSRWVWSSQNITSSQGGKRSKKLYKSFT